MKTRNLGIALVTSALLLAGCATDDNDAAPESESTGDYPVTIENCGAKVTFDRAPEQAVLLKSASVPYLAELGVLDRVAARAGQYPEEYYDQETLDALDEIPLLTDELDTSGHLKISKEVVIAEEPDLVLGQVDNLSRDTLGAVDIPLIEEPALCEEGVDRPDYASIAEQLRVYGTVFGRADQAETAIKALDRRVAAATAKADTRGRTAAVLYPTVGGGVTYAYGTRSMAQAQLDAAGLENVFDDVDERVFEVNQSELLARDPDVLILLYSEGDPAEVEAALEDLPGADKLTAVRDGEVLTQLFNFTEPPSPLAAQGLEQIVDRFGSGS